MCTIGKISFMDEENQIQFFTTSKSWRHLMVLGDLPKYKTNAKVAANTFKAEAKINKLTSYFINFCLSLKHLQV